MNAGVLVWLVIASGLGLIAVSFGWVRGRLPRVGIKRGVALFFAVSVLVFFTSGVEVGLFRYVEGLWVQFLLIGLIEESFKGGFAVLLRGSFFEEANLWGFGFLVGLLFGIVESIAYLVGLSSVGVTLGGLTLVGALLLRVVVSWLHGLWTGCFVQAFSPGLKLIRRVSLAGSVVLLHGLYDGVILSVVYGGPGFAMLGVPWWYVFWGVLIVSVFALTGLVGWIAQGLG